MSRVSLAARVQPPAERTLRVRRRVLQTPVVRFEHPRTGRTVTVAGVVHIARTSYYRQLGIMLTKLEAAGALVFYEGSAAPRRRNGPPSARLTATPGAPCRRAAGS
jgi:hypothetical protein